MPVLGAGTPPVSALRCTQGGHPDVYVRAGQRTGGVLGASTRGVSLFHKFAQKTSSCNPCPYKHLYNIAKIIPDFYVRKPLPCVTIYMEQAQKGLPHTARNRGGSSQQN